jgi:HD-GYP domain-containing protein (c-di-GMP phosphodiesterase class II)
LHLGLPVPGTNWTLVESVPASRALAGVEARIRNLLTILLLSLLAIILGILLLWRHMTAVQQAAAREAGVKLYRSVAEVLLQAIDQRDPGAAEHSRRVAALSRRIAARMGVSGAEADTAELAGALMNVGKLFVPVPLLTKTGALEDAEASQFAEGAARWLDLLAHTPLDLPLEPVLRDAYRLNRGESVDPTPAARTAHIIVTANKAVALMSSRAYRMARTPQETLEILAGTRPAIPPAVLAATADLLAKSK